MTQIQWNKTWKWFFIFVLFEVLLGALFPLWLPLFSNPIGFAGPVLDAQEEKEKASNEYYKALKARKNITPEESKKLRAEIIGPVIEKKKKAAEKAYKDEAKKLYQEMSIKHGLKKLKNYLFGFERKDGKKPKPTTETVFSDDEKEETPTQRTSTPPSPTPKPSEPGLELDSSGIPREIEFPGPDAAEQVKENLEPGIHPK